MIYYLWNAIILLIYIIKLNVNYSSKVYENMSNRTKLQELHSSRMHTARLVTVSSSMHCAEGVSLPGGVCLARGVSLPGGCLPCQGGLSCRGGVCLARWDLPCQRRVDIPACTEADPPCEQNHTHVSNHNLAPTSLRAVKIALCQTKAV